MDDSLCMPQAGFSCFACCPPIRPAGYEHLADRGSWRRMFAENRADFLAGRLQAKAQTGFFCPGLGFLDKAGRRVGCLLHPAANQGRDLRGPTGYRDKCERESCPESRAYAALPPAERAALMELCQGLDSFQFSSSAQNPVRRLLAFGPRATAAAAGLGLAARDELASWPWLHELDSAHGWLLGRLVKREGAELLRRSDLAQLMAAETDKLAKQMGPSPPLEQGPPLRELCGEWEARFWLTLGGRRRARLAELEAWRALAA